MSLVFPYNKLTYIPPKQSGMSTEGSFCIKLPFKSGSGGFLYLCFLLPCDIGQVDPKGMVQTEYSSRLLFKRHSPFMQNTLMPEVAFLSWAFDVSLVSRCGSFALVMQPNDQLLANPFRSSRLQENRGRNGRFTKWPRQSLLGSLNRTDEQLSRKLLLQGFLPLGLCKEQAASCQLRFLEWEHLVLLRRRQSSSEKAAGLPCSRSAGTSVFFVNNA